MKYTYYQTSKKQTVSLAAVTTALVVAAFLSLSFMGTSNAKELESGGGTGVVTTTCSPISSFTAKGDGKVGETGLGSVDMNWSVKPCIKNQNVTVQAQVINWNTKEVVYADDAALLSGKVSLLVKNRTPYQTKVTVYDSVTGAVLATPSQVVGTTPKGGV